jgi:hypothetical protein
VNLTSTLSTGGCYHRPQMRQIDIWAAVLVVVACKGNNDPATTKPNPATKPDPTAPVARAELVLLGTNGSSAAPFVAVSADDAVTVFAHDGAVAAHARIPVGSQHDTVLTNHWLVWTEGTTLRVVDVITGAAKEASLPEALTAYLPGTTSIALSTAGGVEIYDLATAKSVYRLPGAVSQSVYRDSDHVYAFLADADADVHLVDEVTHAEKWKASSGLSSGHEKAKLSLGTVVAVRTDTEVATLDLRTGRTISKRAVKVDPDEVSSLLGKRDAVDTDYREYRVLGAGNAMKLVARDAALQMLWRTPWLLGLPTEPRMWESAAGNLVAFQLKRSGAVAVFDGKTGKLVKTLPLQGRDQFVGISGECALLLDSRALTCTDPKGAERWAHPVGGGDAQAWRLEDGDVLLADGLPLQVSRIDANGKVIWTTPLENTKLDEKHALHEISLDRGWFVKTGMLLLVEPHHLKIVELATGKSHRVSP